MRVADEFHGTLDDDALAAAVEREGHLTVTVDDTERRRSRVRTTTEDGTDLGIVVARELRDGDVLEADGQFVVVSLAAMQAMVLDFAAAEDAALTALELGHAVGNRHWNLAVDGERAYLSVTDSRERMEATVHPSLPDGVTVDYESVPPTLFEDDPAGHTHGEDDGHGHALSHGHSHDHDVQSLDADEGGGEES